MAGDLYPDGSLAGRVRDDLESRQLLEQDKAAAGLALRYAAEIDQGGDLEKLGPSLLKALEALTLTPKSRLLPVKGGTTDDSQSSPLDELRARRRTRADRAADLDATAP